MTVKKVWGHLPDWRDHPDHPGVVVAPIPGELMGEGWSCTDRSHGSLHVPADYFVRLAGQETRGGGLCQTCLDNGKRGTRAKSPDVTSLLP